MSLLNAKKAAGKKAATLIEPNMIVGLGTGSTALCFIEELIQRVKKEGLKIQAVASSSMSANLAKQGGIPLLDINEAPRIDITVDGADEIDQKKRMIKGGGGAHLREKILASFSEEMVVVVDETKLSSLLGKAKLPLEILPYGSSFVERRLKEKGYKGVWRKKENGSLFVTENNHYLLDLTFDAPIGSPEKLDEELLQIPGVIETGFFFKLAGRVVVGYLDDHVEVR